MGANSSSLQPTSAVDGFSDEKHNLGELFAATHISSPLSADGSLSASNVQQWEAALSSDPKSTLARSILNHTDIREALASRNTRIKDAHIFNHQIDFKTGPITSQKSSGRCWIFASTNVLRYSIMRKLKLKDFQLSQSYLFFWDKLNKSNYYLELAIENAHLPIDDRLVYYLSDELISDGGQWDMIVNLFETYGVVPQSVFPESLHSSLSGPINTLLKTKLREQGIILRDLTNSLRSRQPLLSDAQVISTVRSKKEELLKEVYTIISATLGVPPSADSKFEWDYVDAEGKVGYWEGTPKEFYSTFATTPYSPSDSFSLINDPRNEYSKLYTVDKLGNIWGGRPVSYVNTEIDNLKNAVVKLVKAGQPVFFGCDVGQTSERKGGIMDTDLFEYQSAFDITLGLTKAQRLQVNESSMTHAMVISAVHLDKDGKPVRYKVENSWGPDVGDKGYFVMTDKWFEQYVYQVVVPKALAPKDLVKVFEGGNATVFPPWDPMGSLA